MKLVAKIFFSMLIYIIPSSIADEYQVSANLGFIVTFKFSSSCSLYWVRYYNFTVMNYLKSGAGDPDNNDLRPF